ncbi:unnamed protein product [Phyllotreta striolata]|uniref:TOG domain-containing protein n=1 Tax=Phyllotreta striolata TaxID=444603 RepID=A0A9N9XS48_PHYSR|nr:unnamed protein product [Phyllotreta striolata]
MEDEEFRKLPADEKCVHKLWKARIVGYEEITKLFKEIDDEKSPEFGKYLGLVKKFVVDNNVVAQEKGLEATLTYVEHYAHAGKTTAEVMAGIVAKCMAAPKAKTKELALQITLMYIEIEKHEIVQDELMKGMDLKNPKIVSACINACTTALREFGTKIINVKPLLKKISGLLSDRDKGVRDETKLMVIEMFRWIGGPLRAQLQTANLQALQLAELESEFAKIEGQKATPTRYIRSQQAKKAVVRDNGGDAQGDGGEEEEEEGAPEVEIDPFELLPEVEVLSKIPKDFYEKVEAKKWQERKEALEAVEVLVKNPKLQNGDYGDLVRALKKVIQKDSNVVCVAIAGRCIGGLAAGLKKKFQTYAGFCVPTILDKFKEKKQNVVTALREAGDAVYLTTNLEAILEDVTEALDNKNPSIKTETTLFLTRAFTKTSPATINKKLLKAITTTLLKNMNEPDPGVREATAEALGTLMKLVGEKAISPYLVELEKDNLKMSKIKEFHDKAEIIVKFKEKKESPAKEPPARNASSAAIKTKSKPTKKAEISSGSSTVVRNKSSKAISKSEDSKSSARGVTKSASSYSVNEEDDQEPAADHMPRVDVSAQITESLLNELGDKQWKVRQEALTKIEVIISEAKFIKSNLGDLPQSLAARLSDSNVKIAKTALSLCEVICKAMGPQFKQYVRVFLPTILQGLGDNKAAMRASCLDAMNTMREICGYKEFFESEMIADALKSGSPALKIELWNWLAENLQKAPPSQISREELMACIPHLFSNLEDRNADVRKNANEAVLGVMLHLSYETMAKQTEKLKPGSKAVVLVALDKARPNLPVKPLPPTKEKVVKKEKEAKTTRESKPASKKPASKASTASTGRKREEEVDTSPLLTVNSLKQQRTLDENKLKVLKWNFTQPREEFVELLKDQMATANVNKTLMSNMFHNDFRYHIKALESLSEDMLENTQALISNLDLILKWLTLRFFDTNPSVLLKGLEYLQYVFSMLIETKYHITENEAASFIPYLVNKIGDPKDSVRNGVKILLKQLNMLYHVNKLFTFVMEGLKSKNARQRAECLEVLGGIIGEFGISVCAPTPAACLKEIAKQISDRDNSVRNAALNCLVEAYFIIGEKIYKSVGNISDKDMCLLEERIKRSSRKTTIPKPDVNVTVVLPTQKECKEDLMNTVVLSKVDTNNEIEEDIEEEHLPRLKLDICISRLPTAVTESPKEFDGPFRLDPDFMEALERSKPPRPVKPKLIPVDLSFLNEEIKIPTIEEAREQVRARMAKQASGPNETKTWLNLNANVVSPNKQDIVLERLIKNISSPTNSVVLASLVQLHELLNTTRGNAIVDYEEELMKALVGLLKNLQNIDVITDSFAGRLYRNLFVTFTHFFGNPLLGKHMSKTVIKDLMDHMINLLVEERLKSIPDGDCYVRIINLQCINVIEKCDHTNTICALVQLITEYINNDSSGRSVDLVMKCIWRVIKLMPKWGDEIDYDLVLLEVHNFSKQFPTTWWKNRDDTPLRTVKTIVHSSTKIKGGTILLHLGKIPNTSESMVESYILRVLKSMKISEIQHIPVKQETQRRSLSRANHEMLTDIFQKIGNKEDTKEGLNLLYDFMQQHPEANIEPVLTNCSKVFQDYIRNGLKEIEGSRQNPTTT